MPFIISSVISVDFVVIINEGNKCNSVYIDENRPVFNRFVNHDEMRCGFIYHFIDFFNGFTHKQSCLCRSENCLHLFHLISLIFWTG